MGGAGGGVRIPIPAYRALTTSAIGGGGCVLRLCLPPAPAPVWWVFMVPGLDVAVCMLPAPVVVAVAKVLSDVPGVWGWRVYLDGCWDDLCVDFGREVGKGEETCRSEEEVEGEVDSGENGYGVREVDENALGR